MSTFTLTIDKFIQAVPERASEVVRKVSLDMVTSIVLMTPVDTGRARASWGVGLNRPMAVPAGLTDKDGELTIFRASESIANWQPDDDVWIISQLPYIEMLEYGGWNGPTEKVTAHGFSKQAPAGMVRVSMARAPEFINKAVRSLPKEP